jgi:hypothetical protein
VDLAQVVTHHVLPQGVERDGALGCVLVGALEVATALTRAGTDGMDAGMDPDHRGLPHGPLGHEQTEGIASDEPQWADDQLTAP